jgi:hypothetical protein
LILTFEPEEPQDTMLYSLVNICARKYSIVIEIASPYHIEAYKENTSDTMGRSS